MSHKDPIQVLEGLSVSFNRIDQTRPSAISTLETLRTDQLSVKVLSTDYVSKFHNMKKVVSSVTAASIVFGISSTIAFADGGNYHHPPHETPVNIPEIKQQNKSSVSKSERIRVTIEKRESVSEPKSVPPSAPRLENVPIPQTELKESKTKKVIATPKHVSEPELVTPSAPGLENVPMPQTELKETKTKKVIATPKRVSEPELVTPSAPRLENVPIPQTELKETKTKKVIATPKRVSEPELVTPLSLKSEQIQVLQTESKEPKATNVVPTEKHELMTSLAPTTQVLLASETKSITSQKESSLIATREEAVAQLSKLSTAQNRSKVELNQQETSYVVKKGDTLWALAEKFYGDGTLWTNIYDANKELLIKADLRNEKDHGRWIFPGQNLQIPMK